MSSFFQPAPSQLFFTKNDPLDPRCGELFVGNPFPHLRDEDQFVLWGYPDDEGIQLNGGRPGAALAPDSVRTFLYRMTPPLQLEKNIQATDWGNLSTETASLGERHERGRSIAHKAFSSRKFCISIGGGHDYGYSDGAGFLDAALNSAQKPLIINFDAHLDVRPLDRGLTSGTPFFRLLSNYPDQFEFIEFGIQPQCNSRFHYSWARDRNTRLIDYARPDKMMSALANLCQEFANAPTWISFDIDSFSNAYAPGCSQSFASGLQPDFVFDCFEMIFQKLSPWGLSVYEVSPPLDQDQRTSKLAALLIHRCLDLHLRRRGP